MAPVTQPGVTSWIVYLPQGDWVDVWTGNPITGPIEIGGTIELSEVPVFCRSQSWARMSEYFSF